MTIKEIIVTNDFLFHEDHNHNWLLELLSRTICKVSNLKIETLQNEIVDGLCFSRSEFWARSKKSFQGNYSTYNISDISEESETYLLKYLSSETLVLGVELGLDFRCLLDKHGIPFINFWFHPYKLLDDAMLLLNTNMKKVFDAFQEFRVEESKLYGYADYFRVKSKRQGNVPHLIPNSCLFVGQTYKDMSIYDGKKYLKITDFKDKIDEIKLRYSHLYYSFHPMAGYDKDVDFFIEDDDFITPIEGNIYEILSSDNISKVVAISSSVVYEAQYFDKESEYLYRPLFDIDTDFGINSFVSIYNDWFSEYFWSKVFIALGMDVPLPRRAQLFYNEKNKLRDLIGLYYAYDKFDSVKVLEKKLIDRQKSGGG